MIKNYYIIFENNHVKSTLLPKTITLEKKYRNKISKITITIFKNIPINVRLYIIHTEKKNRHCNVVYKNINFNIKKNVVANITNIYFKNNTNNTLFCTRYTHTLEKKSILYTVSVTSTYDDIKNYISTQNIQEPNTSLELFYIILPNNLSNLHIQSHLAENTKINICTVLKTIEKQKNNINIKTIHNGKSSSSTNTIKVVTHKNTNLDIKTAVTIKENANNITANTCSKALVLSNNSEIVIKPYLKILNNDVTCTHGASIGLIDNNAIQYMQARGIEINKAKLIIATGFTKEILDKITDNKIKSYINTIY